MPLRITPASLLLPTILGSAISLAHGQQTPARPAAALPGVTARGAGRLTGTVTDGATGKPIAYASVAVLGTTGTPVTGGVCGDDGTFALPGLAPGTYTLRVSFLGYQDLARPGVVVPASGTLALGELPLTSAARNSVRWS